MTLSVEEAAVGGALIAAGTAVLTTVVNVWAARVASDRGSFRALLDSDLGRLGDLSYELVAVAVNILKAQSDGSLQKWKGEAARAATELDELRRKVRYPLWGIDGALRQLRSVPVYAEHLRADSASAQKLQLESSARN